MSGSVSAAIDAHRKAWADFCPEARSFHARASRHRGQHWHEYQTAREAYEGATDGLVRSARLIASPGDLQAFADYVASLHAYGRSDVAAGVYAIECRHLSDAIAAIAVAMRRLSMLVDRGADTPRYGETL
ncbi:MAG: hypothetical protein PGN25_05305 [Methylorubrum populi]